ncbi:MAG TPA: hypothetical protein VND45_11450 [Thermoanaerobaculia bacterium]|jgi:hypothetical protein|nr:hypothetical protein [Thermoanaerobaculia bacterium]
MWKKVVLAIAFVVVAGVALVVAKIGVRNVVGMLRYDQRRDGELKVGDRAPAAMLVALDGASRQPLLAGGGKPSVLIFGSFT